MQLLVTCRYAAHEVQRLFFAFPNGRPGAGLLLLRTLVAVVVALYCLQGLSPAGNSLTTRALELVRVVGATLILIGFVTPLSAVSVCGASAALWFLDASDPFEGLNATFLIAICTALALLGPGAWSIDARLFGRREILIPREPASQHFL
jgi:putative oxidoreductase